MNQVNRTSNTLNVVISILVVVGLLLSFATMVSTIAGNYLLVCVLSFFTIFILAPIAYYAHCTRQTKYFILNMIAITIEFAILIKYLVILTR